MKKKKTNKTSSEVLTSKHAIKHNKSVDIFTLMKDKQSQVFKK